MKARTALVLYLAHHRATKGGAGIVWSSSVGDYFRTDTGQVVDGRELRASWDATVQAAGGEVGRLTDQMLSQRISVQQYREQMRGLMRDLTVGGYMTGRGGHAQMNPADWLAVARGCKQQYGYVDNFAHQLQAGTAGSEAQIRARAQQYARAGYRPLEEGQRSAKLTAGYTQERRNAVMDQGTCDECARLAGLGWQPVGSLPTPGTGTPCGANCRCALQYKGNPPMSEAEIAYLFDKVQSEYAAAGETGFSYDIYQHDQPAAGFALSIYPQRERVIKMDQLHFEDIQQFAEDNADLLLDRGKFNHIMGGWASGGKIYLDVSVIVPEDQRERAAKLTLEYNQLAMWSLHEGREYTADDCKQILESKSMTTKAKRERRRLAFLVDPMIPGATSPQTGERWTFAEHLDNIVRIGEHLHENHDAKQMTRRSALEYVVKQYLVNDGQDIADFWRLRPDLKPADWAERQADYMDDTRRRWGELAWDA